MAKKKVVAKKSSKKKAPVKASARPKAAAKAAARPKATARKTAPKPAPKASAKAGKPARPQSKNKVRARITGTAGAAGPIEFNRRGLGSDAAGQSGDTEGLRETARADSESVEELAEEGQAFEAEAVEGVEDAPDPDEGEVTTHEVPEDDVPEEYDNED